MLFLAVVLVLLVVMTASVSFMVLARFLPTTTGGWVLEVSEYLMVPIAMLPASWILRHGGHVSLDVVYERLGPRTQRLATFVASLFGAAVVSIFANAAIRAVRQAYLRDLVLVGFFDVPRFAVIAPVAIGLTMLAARLWRNVLALLVGMEVVESEQQVSA